MTFHTEFPDYPAHDMPDLPEGFEDSSWHNDVCPSYMGKKVMIFIDYADVTLREVGGAGNRFVVYALDDDGCLTAEELLATDDWNKVLALVAAKSEV